MSDMRPDDETLRALASATGKPLEVICAREFLNYGHGWTVQLGSYFHDYNGPPRELDVLATREETIVQKTRGVSATCRVRALISCRGFAEDTYPITYSVAAGSQLVQPPALPAAFRGWPVLVQTRSTEAELAATWLRLLGLEKTPPVVAIDVIEPELNPAKRSACSHRLKGDRRIYTAIDSAVKAALYWIDSDTIAIPELATLTVPICVFSERPSDFNIDTGRLGSPELRSRAYQTNSFPSGAGHAYRANISTVMMAETEIGSLVPALESLFLSFRDLASGANR